MKLVIAFALVWALTDVAGVSDARADNAPMWESPVGLTPGAPTLISMQSEDVSVRIVERGSTAVAMVEATFDMSLAKLGRHPLTCLPRTRAGSKNQEDNME